MVKWLFPARTFLLPAARMFLRLLFKFLCATWTALPNVKHVQHGMRDLPHPRPPWSLIHLSHGSPSHKYLYHPWILAYGALWISHSGILIWFPQIYFASGHSSPSVNDYCICLNIITQGSLHPAKLLLRRRRSLVVLESTQSPSYFWVLSQLLYFKQQSTVWGRPISPKWPCLMWLDIYGRHLTSFFFF